MSFQAAVLVVLVLVVQALVRNRLAPRWRCALWLVVVARLCLPISFSSGLSIFNLVPWPSDRPNLARARTVSQAIADRPLSDRLTKAQDSKLEPIKIPTQEGRELRVDRETEHLAAGIHTARLPIRPSGSLKQVVLEEGRRNHLELSLGMALLSLWAAGAGVLAWRVIATSAGLARRLRRLKALSDPNVLRLLEECRARLGVHRHLRIVESRETPCPALHGLVRLTLLVPPRIHQQLLAPGIAVCFSARAGARQTLGCPTELVGRSPSSDPLVQSSALDRLCTVAPGSGIGV